MRILVINNGYPSEEEPNIYIFVHKQVQALLEAGYKVVVLDIDLRSIRWKRRYGCFYEKYQGVDIFRVSFPFVTVKLAEINYRLNQFIGVSSFKKIVKRYGAIDIVHCHFGKGAGNAGGAIKKKFQVPLVITEHSSSVLQEKKITLKYALKAYYDADKVMPVSKALMDVLSFYNVHNIELIPNVIDTDLFQVKKEIHSKDAFTFLSVGQLIPSKRFDLLLEAFGKLRSKGYNCRLTIVGKGVQEQELVRLIKESKIDNITFIEQIPNNEIVKQYNKSDCFALVSDYETFGVVYAEALACGIPAIATDNGGSKEIINSGNGVIVKCGDKNEIANAMEYMIQNYKQYSPQKLHNEMEKKFGKESFIISLSNVYSEVSKGKNDNENKD